MLRISGFFFLLMTSATYAQGQCYEPSKPDAGLLHSSGYSGTEIRVEFRTYFDDVEDYLNCINGSSRRIREDAKLAAYDFDHALDRYPAKKNAKGDATQNTATVDNGEY